MIPAVDTIKLQKVKITHHEARQLKPNTCDQALNSLWQIEKSVQITASNFGSIILRKAAVTAKFVESLNGKKFTSAATSYGSSNEKVEHNMYRKKTNDHVHDCGFVVNPDFPYIGAYPDGKV